MVVEARGGSNIVGVDTHGDVHVAAVLDPRGRLLGSRSFPSSAWGHRALERWAVSKGHVGTFGRGHRIVGRWAGPGT